MKIVKSLEGDAAMLSLVGWIDALSAPELTRAAVELEAEVAHLVLDFQGVEYISSSGVSALVGVKRIMADREGDLALVRVPDFVSEVLRMAGVANRFNIY